MFAFVGIKKSGIFAPDLKTTIMKGFVCFGLAAAVLLLMMGACGDVQNTPQVEGHYTYEHAFEYDMEGNHMEVSERGTMDFYADSTALDSARQVYVVTLADGDTVQWVYNYVSPSRWHLDGDDFCFAGVKEGFRMEVVEGEEELALAQRIAEMYKSGIEYEYKFHLDTLTAERLQWSFTYRDGHSDTWVFFRR